MNDLVEKLVQIFADEIQKRVKQHDISGDELAKNIETMLQSAEWFQKLVKENIQGTVETAVSREIDPEGIADEVTARVERNFDIQNYADEVRDLAENTIEKYDFSDIVQTVLDDVLDSVVEEKVDDKISAIEDRRKNRSERVDANFESEIEGIKKRIAYFDAILNAITQVQEKK